ncbi:aspartyl-phosphate phosphatase Spo0E family protein [Bacillus sp. HMF5848]|nr:aspartyl-phosphate phosphatase Spo0E family protein [Bacillus sp. HMF5848]
MSKIIEALRHELIRTAFEKGFVHPDTIRVSQKLDIVLNKYTMEIK